MSIIDKKDNHYGNLVKPTINPVWKYVVKRYDYEKGEMISLDSFENIDLARNKVRELEKINKDQQYNFSFEKEEVRIISPVERIIREMEGNGSN